MPNVNYVARCLKQYKNHTRVRKNGDHVISLGHGLYDLFSGTGWKNQSRFRVVKLRDSGEKQLIQVSGINLSREYRNELLSESV